MSFVHVLVVVVCLGLRFVYFHVSKDMETSKSLISDNCTDKIRLCWDRCDFQMKEML